MRRIFTLATLVGGAVLVGNPNDHVHGQDSAAFIQLGKGALPRTLLDKARDVIDLRDFGAKCDGSSDDAAALANAIAAAAGRAITIPGATCVLRAKVTVANQPLTLVGQDRYRSVL